MEDEEIEDTLHEWQRQYPDFYYVTTTLAQHAGLTEEDIINCASSCAGSANAVLAARFPVYGRIILESLIYNLLFVKKLAEKAFSKPISSDIHYANKECVARFTPKSHYLPDIVKHYVPTGTIELNYTVSDKATETELRSGTVTISVDLYSWHAKKFIRNLESNFPSDKSCADIPAEVSVFLSESTAFYNQSMPLKNFNKTAFIEIFTALLDNKDDSIPELAPAWWKE